MNPVNKARLGLQALRLEVPAEVADDLTRLVEEAFTEVARETHTSLLHPEFGTEWREPDGECYKAYQRGRDEVTAAMTALADEWDARLRDEFHVGDEYSSWHARELRDALPKEADRDS